MYGTDSALIQVWAPDTEITDDILYTSDLEDVTDVIGTPI
jgi:hypothetical protein